MTGRRTIEIRWSSQRSRWTEKTPPREPIDADDQRMELVISLIVLDDDRGLLHAWLDAPRGRRTLRARQPVRCAVLVEAGMTHIDVHREPRGSSVRLAALSMHDPDCLLFAQTSLLHEIGWPGGSYDPPTLIHVHASEGVASA